MENDKESLPLGPDLRTAAAKPILGWVCLALCLPGWGMLTYSVLRPTGHRLSVYSFLALFLEVILPGLGFMIGQPGGRAWPALTGRLLSLTLFGLGLMLFGLGLMLF